MPLLLVLAAIWVPAIVVHGISGGLRCDGSAETDTRASADRRAVSSDGTRSISLPADCELRVLPGGPFLTGNLICA